MRRSVTIMSGLFAVLLSLAVLAPAVAAEATRELRVELSADAAAAFAVENLAGSMRVVPGSGTAVVAVATIHAESDEIAGLVRFEQVTDDKGRPTLRVRYPIDKYDTLRYKLGNDAKESSWGHWFGGDGSRLDYDGKRVKVSRSSGVLLYADVLVQLPARQGEAIFKNHIGTLEARDVEGTLRFETASGDLTLDKVKGTIKADTGSGDLKATNIEGTLACDTGSGDCVIDHFNGDAIKCDVGSGDITIRSGAARRIDLDTGSGDVILKDIDAEEVIADTGSGDLTLECGSARLKKITTETGSGDVVLRLGPDASFEARADQGSGDLVNRYADAQPIAEGRTIVGYRRGDARTRIRVETGSGDFVIEPGGAKASI